MTAGEVVATAQALVAAGKGLLAVDESNPACSKRFAGTRISRPGEARAPTGP